ncbi:glutathione S-transferase family protein [Limnobacter parvus]|uniref:Glutathione S-transferase family protein n=1 Tax=Limnobacter parvus TaxID=2939690 RepID=A0ABT1XL90_9BURK|nr:glutathione S-transferase family protein [Limnobacter parvus]MCR2747631.1 glutathione S-transferase family protein [Limnobacter parvus]
MTMPEILKVHGLDLSYFTGKLEAYLRNKQIPYELIEMDTGDFKRCGKATGVAQMPQVEWANGQWLSDTTLIIEFFENLLPQTPIMPPHAAMHFIAQLLEDFGDEWLWRPALYYRWAHAQDARLMSHRLANGMMRDVPLPWFARRWAILNRQRFHFLWMDGVRPNTAKRVQAHYIETLDALEQILNRQPFILGQRPTLADYGLYGSMFRHFFCDPTPAQIMRTRAPAVHEWVARMWNTRIADYSNAEFQAAPADNLEPLINIVCSEFIPYMQANEQAIEEQRRHFEFNSKGTLFKLPAQRYRAWRYQRLRFRYAVLPSIVKAELGTYFPELGTALFKPVTSPIAARIESLPITNPATMTSRTW